MNRQPFACKANALPVELTPHIRPLAGLEPATSASLRRSTTHIHVYTHMYALSYSRHSAPRGTRTLDPLIKSQVLLPTELLAHNLTWYYNAARHRHIFYYQVNAYFSEADCLSESMSVKDTSLVNGLMVTTTAF